MGRDHEGWGDPARGIRVCDNATMSFSCRDIVVFMGMIEGLYRGGQETLGWRMRKKLGSLSTPELQVLGRGGRI